LVLEFLGAPEPNKLSETELETAIINNLQQFLLELGRGFAFIKRQKRITFDNTHYYCDLVFYHAILKCYVVVDLKIKPLTHGDLGQMLMIIQLSVWSFVQLNMMAWYRQIYIHQQLN
jgi:predicted nuclease of restriction endonuclease-like (RecB) superfamily